MPENKYTLENVVSNPTTDEAKSAIGREVYYSNSPSCCIYNANKNDKEFLGVLGRTEESGNPFHIKEHGNWRCIIVKKQPSYEERAKQWIRENNLKVGDYVKVIRRAQNYEDGWDGRWVEEMDDFVGKVISVSGIGKATGAIISYCCCDRVGYDFPYFVLKKVASSEAKTVPFKDSDEFLGHYGSSLEQPKETPDYFYRFLDGMWIRNRHTETLCQVVSIGTSGVYLGGLDYEVDWDKLYEDFEFLDGSPCGKEITYV